MLGTWGLDMPWKVIDAACARPASADNLLSRGALVSASAMRRAYASDSGL